MKYKSQAFMVKSVPGNGSRFDIFPTPKQVEALAHADLNIRGLTPLIRSAIVGTDHPMVRLALQQLEELCKTIKVGRRQSGRLTIRVAIDPHAIAEDKTGQGYRLCVTPNPSIDITGTAPLGLLYGVQTFAQLYEQTGVRLPYVEIADWPDYEYRLSANWVQNCEVARWCFDRGQGIKRFVEDGKRRIDWALKYKINMIYFDFSYGDGRAEMFPGYSRILSTLNRYARERGIRLMTGLVTSCGMINRKSYPDGPPYQCLTRNIQGEDVGDPPYGGWCWSNQPAWRIKCDKIRRYVQANEPGTLYLHSFDIARYKDVAASWKSRCPQCRRQWPDDAIASPRGMAGAFAHVDNLMLDAVFGVKNKRTGYDARRDCIVHLVSPAYGFYFEDDADWKEEIRYYEQLSRGLKYVVNVQFGIREQGFNKNADTLRVKELAESLRRNGKGHGVFVDVFAGYPGGGNTHKSPGQGFAYYRPIQPLPAIYSSFEGAATVASMEAHADFDVHAILCNQYAWNSRPAFHTEPIRNYREWKNIYEGAYRGFYYPNEIYGCHGLVRRICQSLYGRNAGRYIAEAYSLRAIDEDEALPLFQPESLGPVRATWKVGLAPEQQEAWRRRWEQIEQVTREACQLMRTGRSQGDFNRVQAQTIDWQINVLALGLKMTLFLKLEADICARPGQKDARHLIQTCRRSLHAMARFIRTQFPPDTKQFFQQCDMNTSDGKYTPNDATLYPDNGLLSNMRLWKNILRTFEAELNECGAKNA